jgi:SAM-dependent methyltransferase
MVTELTPSFPGGIGKILDVGSGSAAWSLAFAEHDSRTRVTALDLPNVIECTRANVSARRLDDQYEFITGDMRSGLPEGQVYDLVILGHVIHGDGPERAQELIRRCADLLGPDGVLLIAEILPDLSDEPLAFPALFSLNMLVHTSEGDTFSIADFDRWLRCAGLTEIRHVDVPFPSPVIIAGRG